MRLRGIAFDVALIHIASMSNLMAALGWALVDLARASRAARTRGGRRHRVRTAVRTGEHQARAAVHHVAHSFGTRRSRHRRCDLPSAHRLDHRHTVTAAQHVGGAGPADLGPRPVAAPPTRRHGVASVAHVGHRIRTRETLVPRPTVLAGGHDRGDDSPVEHLRGDAGLDDYPRPVPAQIGGVARSDDPCPVEYRRT